MESTNDLANGLLDTIIHQLNVMAGYMPAILTVILVLIIGWIVARVLRRIVRKLAAASNRWMMRLFPSGIFSGARMSALAVTLLGEIVFWATMLITLTLAAQLAELGSVSESLAKITAQLPNLIAGMVIVVAGYFLSVFVREHLATDMPSQTASSSPLPGRIAQGTIFAIALIVGLDQIGIDVALLIGLAIVIAAGILVALAVAFASSARIHISNLIGIRTAHANLATGMTIRLGDIQGEIVELTSTVIALDTDEGRVLIPGRLADEAVITVMGPSSAK